MVFALHSHRHHASAVGELTVALAEADRLPSYDHRAATLGAMNDKVNRADGRTNDDGLEVEV